MNQKYAAYSEIDFATASGITQMEQTNTFTVM